MKLICYPKLNISKHDNKACKFHMALVRKNYIHMKNSILIMLISLVCFNSVEIVNGQTLDAEQNKLYRKARNYYDRGNFQDAVEQYNELLNRHSNSFLYNYELGLLYFYELNDKKASIPYFEVAIKNMKDTTIDIFNYLGQAYQSCLEYDKAMSMYQIYSAIPPKPGVIKISMKKYIQRCIEEKEKIEEINQQRDQLSESGLQVINAGAVINSEYNDIAPVYINDQSLLITSSRNYDYQFEVYINKPYIVTKGADGFYDDIEALIDSKYSNLVFDPDWHLIITSVTSDLNKVLYTYENDIYVRVGGFDKKIEPVKLPREVNMARQHYSAAISPDGMRMVFSLYDRKTKCWDLYFSTCSNSGVWGKAQKIEKLSSTSDEKYPCFSPDGYTLYFSSTGFNSLGGFDIFKSDLMPNNEWSTPERLPEPVNSTHNDIWFNITPKGDKAYFSSDRPGGFGQLDIYEVIY